MIRRIAVAVVAVALIVCGICSTAVSGRTLEQYRAAQSQPATVRSASAGATADGDDGNGSSSRGGSSSDGTAADSENTGDAADSSDTKNGADSSKTTADGKTDGKSDAKTDTKDADIAATLASDDKAKPLTDDEKNAIRSRARATAQEAAANTGGAPLSYTYCLRTKGDVGNTTAFANIVFSTLNDPKGWPRAGATFEQVADADCGLADMDIILSQAQYMTSFSSYCSVEYSCRVGQEVIINDDRWDGGVDAWLDAGGTLSRYREMVINHEVGHRLGHIDNETTCAGAGQPAPLMQEQSMHLDGCVANEWPLDHELWIG
ncbi:DUF3152 domain-containing protein [Bifidobacterium aerophilum]|uniref:DUF3152 domain-containing protein n=1 Tax=Bifidobacterium aerophilum TaxID=1798155 RepID=A0A6N9Z6S9_9BIFI|nr:DUF3152 domain-containing protein [Bifidobacterium aerophilum]NEG90201.1 DUF3152 domain-containing protein [Bifidobacterium aerophilum]